MRKIYLFFLLLCMQVLSAQFTENDIKFWVGTGSKKHISLQTLMMTAPQILMLGDTVLTEMA